ncbi:MAG TPA: hypothetical protein PLI52_01470 [Prochlorococcaceae cyanobacterium AMR_MDS_5431]|nr:hypothetical protein [Prochlorococcaceae cyanobacterium AMR_MDS_5431]
MCRFRHRELPESAKLACKAGNQEMLAETRVGESGMRPQPRLLGPIAGSD